MDPFFEDSTPVLNKLVLTSFRCDRKMLSSDFFHSYDGIFRSYTDVFPKKVHFLPKRRKWTFSAVKMDFGTFSILTMEFSTVKMSIFGSSVLILFYSYDGNPNTPV